GLVSISDGVEVPKGASYYRPRKECPSIFEGEQPCGTCGSSQAGPHFDSWFPDNRTVLYTEAGLNSSKLKLWDTKTGARRTLAASGASGMISADGRYVCFVAPEGEKTITSRSKRVLFQVLDLQSRKVILSKEVPAHTSFQCSPPQ
ncbi:MAG TPA: hypothetical protein VMT64_01360, partial [Candidatus Binataceae bacterium]|nr:hypothetical protein [Candidatus Binataceae bacterium]